MDRLCNHCMAKIDNYEGVCTVCGKVDVSFIPAHHLLPGTILNGKFYVGEALGEGGFGITYIGHDIKLDMKVAIKEFYPNGYVNRNNSISTMVNDSTIAGCEDFFENGRERFLKEAQILAKFCDEPGVVDVRDFFEENNTAYIIMEFLDGVDLKTYLKQNGTLTPECTIQLMLPVMNSLIKIHSQGLIHRDISPDNIMIIGDKVKLLDFGAARTVSTVANKSLSVVLKPGYAPEEQYRSKGIQGPWTDVYALCATMYKCITGITPDDATQRVFNDEVLPPSALNIPIKPEYERAIMKGMSVRQTDRYQCIEDFVMGLQGMEVADFGAEQTFYAENNLSDIRQTLYSSDNKTLKPDEVVTWAHTDNYSNGFEKVNVTPADVHQSLGVNKPDKKRKIKYTVIGIAVAVIALIIFLILPKDEDPDTLKIDNNVNVTTQAPDEIAVSDKKDDADNVEMSDELYDFTFKLEGVVYKLPCEYEDFTSNGWTISSSGYNSDTKIAGNSSDSFAMAKDGRRITVYSYNLSGNTKPIKDCKVGGVGCDAYYDVDFVIAKGITVESDAEEIRNAFGVPGYSNSGNNYESMAYYAVKDSSNNSVRFYCYEDGSYSSITLKNFIETEDDKTTTNMERPEYLDEYTAPVSMGSDLKSAVVKIEGKLYQLPAPVSVFIDDGWVIAQQSGDVVAGGSDYIRVEKGGKDIQLYIANYSEYQVPVENCAVYKVHADTYSEVDVSIGSEIESITVGTSKEDVVALISDDFNLYESTYSDTYSYSEYKERDFILTILINKETGKVSSISVSCKTWEY